MRNIISSAWCTCVAALLLGRVRTPPREEEEEGSFERKTCVLAFLLRRRSVPSRVASPVSNVIPMHENRLLCGRSKRKKRERQRNDAWTSERDVLYTKTETGRVGRCSCCRRRCHPLTTVVGVACVQRPGPVFCCGGGGGRVRRNKSRGGREGTCGGGDRVPLARTTVCVCSRALFSYTNRRHYGRTGGGAAVRGNRCASTEPAAAVFGARVTRARLFLGHPTPLGHHTVHGSECNIPRPVQDYSTPPTCVQPSRVGAP